MNVDGDAVRTVPSRSAPRRPPPRLRSLLLPQEHGVYPLFAEPVLLGLALAPSWAGATLALAGAAAVLSQQPAALGLADLRRGRSYPRTRLALGAAAALALAALVALTATAFLVSPARTGAAAWWLPLGVALVPAGVQLWLDRAFRGATLAAQLSGATALAGLASAIALAGGAPVAIAWAGWAALALRVAASIPNVRARLRRARKRSVVLAPAFVGATALLLGAGIGAAFGLLSPLAVAAAAVLALRAAWSLRPGAPDVGPARIGVAEMLAGLAWVAILATGGLQAPGP